VGNNRNIAQIHNGANFHLNVKANSDRPSLQLGRNAP
jgi:hypothetical protein